MAGPGGAVEYPQGPLGEDASSGLEGAGLQHRAWGPGAWGEHPGGVEGPGRERGGVAGPVWVPSLRGPALGGGPRGRHSLSGQMGGSMVRGSQFGGQRPRRHKAPPFMLLCRVHCPHAPPLLPASPGGCPAQLSPPSCRLGISVTPRPHRPHVPAANFSGIPRS